MSLVENTLQNFKDGKESVFLDALKKRIEFSNENIIELSDLLRDTKSIIAGGSVLSAYSNFEINDIDIYVNFSSFPKLIDFLHNTGKYRKFSFINLAPAYDQSFFRKNNIMYHFIATPKNYLDPNVDILIVPDNYDTRLVAQNFDLSFCEIWFDGQNTYAVDIEGIRNKEGILKPDYTESLLKYFNQFIIKRIKKYIRRGFRIKYIADNKTSDFYMDNIGVYIEGVEKNTINNLTEGIDIKYEGKTMYPEELIVKCILRLFLNNIDSVNYNTSGLSPMYLIYNLLLEKFTIRNLFNVLQKFFRIADPYKWKLATLNDVRTEEELDSASVNAYSYDYDKEDRKNVDDPKTFEPIPDIKNLRINLKIKLLIVSLILNVESNKYQFIHNEPYIQYFNKVLNFDISCDDTKYYVPITLKVRNTQARNAVVPRGRESQSIGYNNLNNNMFLSKIIFQNDFYKLSIGRLYTIYAMLNERDAFIVKTLDYFIDIKGLLVFDNSMGDDADIRNYLLEDVNNIIFVLDTPTGYKLEGITLDSLYDFRNKIIVECNGTYEKGAVALSHVIFDNWYFKIGFSTNYNISLTKVNLIIDSIERDNINRIFLLTDIKELNSITFLENIQYGQGKNIFNHGFNYISATHCDDSKTYVFTNVIKAKSEFDLSTSGGAEESKENTTIQESKENDGGNVTGLSNKVDGKPAKKRKTSQKKNKKSGKRKYKNIKNS